MKWYAHLSWRHNGFGFMFLWIGGLYVQFGTVKLIVSRVYSRNIEPISFPDDTFSFRELANKWLTQQ